MARRTFAILTICFWIAFLPAGYSEAAALRVAPILVDVAKGATSTIELQNLEKVPADVQIRIFRWVQKNGKDQLVETRDVVASPPFAKIRPGGRNTIRIVRLSKRPITGEESYRLLIDQIPRRTKSKSLNIGIALRYSVPVFFGTTADDVSRLRWSVTQQNGQTVVTATNPGKRRVRLSAMTLSGSSGRKLSFGKGLVGYVLGGSTATWKRKGLISSTRTGGRVLITAQTEHGKIRREATLQAAQ